MRDTAVFVSLSAAHDRLGHELDREPRDPQATSSPGIGRGSPEARHRSLRCCMKACSSGG